MRVMTFKGMLKILINDYRKQHVSELIYELQRLSIKIKCTHTNTL